MLVLFINLLAHRQREEVNMSEYTPDNMHEIAKKAGFKSMLDYCAHLHTTHPSPREGAEGEKCKECGGYGFFPIEIGEGPPEQEPCQACRMTGTAPAPKETDADAKDVYDWLTEGKTLGKVWEEGIE